MLRSVLAVRDGRVALALEGGHVVWASSSSVREVGAAAEGAAPTAAIGVVVSHAQALNKDLSPTEITAVGLSSAGGGGGAGRGLVAAACDNKQVVVWDASTTTLQASSEVHKKPTFLLFARKDGKEKDLLLAADKYGDLLTISTEAAPAPTPASAPTTKSEGGNGKGVKLVLGHTATAITCVALSTTASGGGGGGGEGGWLATGDRGEHVRISNFPNTFLIKSYLCGHSSFISAVSTVPGNGREHLLLTCGGDKKIGLFDVDTGKRLAWCSIQDVEGMGPTEEEALLQQQQQQDQEQATSQGGEDNDKDQEEGGGEGKDGGGGSGKDADVEIAEGEQEGGGKEGRRRARKRKQVGRGQVDENAEKRSIGSVPLKVLALRDGTVLVSVHDYAGLLMYRLQQETTTTTTTTAENQQEGNGKGSFSLTFSKKVELPQAVLGMCCGAEDEEGKEGAIVYIAHASPGLLSAYRVSGQDVVPISSSSCATDAMTGSNATGGVMSLQAAAAEEVCAAIVAKAQELGAKSLLPLTRVDGNSAELVKLPLNNSAYENVKKRKKEAAAAAAAAAATEGGKVGKGDK